MSIVSQNERMTGRGSNQTVDNHSATRTWLVELSAASASFDGEYILENYNGPQLEDDHPVNSNLWVTARTPRPISDDGIVWEVLIAYSAKLGETWSVGGSDEDVPQVSFGFIARSTVAEKAYAPEDDRTTPSLPVLNSALKSFDPPVMSEEYLRVILITRKVRTSDFDPATAEAYQGTINSDAVTIAGIPLVAKQGLCKSFRVRPEYSSVGTMYWVEEIEIIVDRKGWTKKVLDQGFYWATHIESASNEYMPATDDLGNRSNEPILLDGAGGQLAAGAAPVFMSYDILFPTSWSGWLPVNLPT